MKLSEEFLKSRGISPPLTPAEQASLSATEKTIADKETAAEEADRLADAKAKSEALAKLDPLIVNAVASIADIAKPGDFLIVVEGDKTSIILHIPGEGIIALPIFNPADFPTPPANAEKVPWVWNGDKVKPTLTPSIFVNPPSGWHGFLTDGVLKRC